ncbi:MAG: FAD-dependent tricarballylate dehydrogenase TcuA [Pseudomonadota bacterium]
MQQPKNITADLSLITPGNGEPATDVVVIGGGNAALCAAITAAEAGASVTLLERAPHYYRGGNSRHTRNFRCAHNDNLGVLSGQYELDEFYDDLLRVTKGNTDEQLAKVVISNSADSYQWMSRQGVIFQPSLSGTLSLSRTNAFFLGGGKALVNAYYQRCEALGVNIIYDATVLDLHIENTRCDGVLVDIDGVQQYLRAGAFVIAAGGFESNKEWLAQAWGEAARNFLIRGTSYNRGEVLKQMLAHGADSIGDPTQCHAVAIDGRAPEYDGGIVTRLDCVPFSVVLNQHGQRFYNEGEDVWPKRYAIWGRLVAAQPDQVAYAIIDSKSAELFMPSVFPATCSDSLADLVTELGLPADQSMATINAFNAACSTGEFHPTELDGLTTQGIEPPKTNWARPINEPPYYGYTLRPGVTFTYLGVNVDKSARITFDGKPSDNLWAAGEIMAGNILGEGYLAGFGMTIGTVFGRLAGAESASFVLNQQVS